MLLCNEPSRWYDVLDDADTMIRRLKTLEHLLQKCCFDIPPAGCHFSDETRDGYDGSEMLHFLDESLTSLIQEYERQISTYEDMFRRGATKKVVDLPVQQDSYVPNCTQIEEVTR